MSLIAGHHDLDLDVLDQLSVGGRDVAQKAVLTGHGTDGAVVLATCNRYEVYLEAADDAALAEKARRVVDALAAASGLSPERLDHHLHTLTGDDVAAHLFGVAAGLDSMVVGEQEISGQVRRALSAAREAGTTSSGLERMFQAASRSARAVANETGLGAAGRSLVGVALDLAHERLARVAGTSGPAWSSLQVVLVGTGSYAGASLAALRARGVRDVRVFSPSGRAAVFAEARGILAVPDGGLADAVAVADVIVACSGVAGPILDAQQLGAIRAAGAPHPLVVVDLALRHDVDPSVADLPGVDLVTLHTVAEHTPGQHSAPVEHARALVTGAVDGFMLDQRMRERSAGVVAARVRALEAAEAELARRREAAVDLDEAARERTVRAGRRKARAAVHGPTVRARTAARDGDAAAYAAALEELRVLATEPVVS